MKKLFLIPLIVLSAVSLTACLNPVHLNERAIVQAVGIDWEDGQIHMTFQIFAPAGDGGGGISANSDNAKIIETFGQTVSEAVQNASLVQGKQLFVGHNRLIVIGKELAKQGLEQPLSFFSSNAWSRQGVRLAVAENTANEILTAKINQGVLPAETLEKITVNAEKNGIIKNIRMYEFLEALESEYASSYLPVIRLTGKEKDSGNDTNGEDREKIDEVSSVELSGTAIFSDAKMTGILSGEETRGLLWMTDSLQSTVLVTHTRQYKSVALRIYSASSDLTARYDGEHLIFSLNLSCQASIGETMPNEGESGSIPDLEELANAGQAAVKQECHAVFRKAIGEFHTDIFGLGDIVWRTDPEHWKILRNNWPAELAKSQLEVTVQMDIDRVGLEVK